MDSFTIHSSGANNSLDNILEGSTISGSSSSSSSSTWLFLALAAAATLALGYFFWYTEQGKNWLAKVVPSASSSASGSSSSFSKAELPSDPLPQNQKEAEEATSGPVADRIAEVVRSFEPNHHDRASYDSDTANSEIQTGNKNGWCYIGEDRGFRACAKVGMRDQCMSGDIFPTHDICMNPNLRT